MPLALASRLPARHLIPGAALIVAALTLTSGAMPALAVRQSGPNVPRGTAYLVSPGNLIDGQFYESFPRTADFGLTIDGALALAASHDQNSILKKIVQFIAQDGRDPSGKTVNYWTGIGTRYAAGGAIGKEALLAEVVGANPRHFAGHNLIAALNDSVCPAASAGSDGPCAGPGNYHDATSVFDQAYGIMAQLRAGQAVKAGLPIAFLEQLRNADGSFPSLIPDSHDHDVDSTAIAVMALALVTGPRAQGEVTSGLAWIASRQQQSGGFPGVGGVSINSTGLAISALTLRAARYRGQIRSARTFLASEQNANGGFNSYATGQRGSSVRATTQAVSGAVGISFGTLRDVLSAGPPSQSGGVQWWWLAPVLVLIVAIRVAVTALLGRRRRVPGGQAGPAPDQMRS
jgi:hypothetical protein